MEKLLPSSIEAEQGVLGSILLDPDALADVADILTPTDFYRESHQALYRTMLALSARGEPVDYVTVCDEASPIDAGYVASLVSMVPTSGHARAYAEMVAGLATRRRLIHVAGQIAALAYESSNAQAALEKAGQLLSQVERHTSTGGFESDTDILTSYLRDLEDAAKRADSGGLIGLPTGFGRLDFFLGGMQKSDLLVLAARPGMGKSALMLSAASQAVARYGKTVGVFSLEMGKKQLIQRLVAFESRLDLFRLRNVRIREDQGDWDKLVKAQAALSTNRLWIDDTGGLPLSQLLSRARLFHARHGLDLLIVDYLQLVHGSDEKRSKGLREQEISEIVQGLKALAKELDIPILALAQLSRKVEERQDKIPMLSDLRESGSIEQEADVVMFLYRDEYYNRQTSRPGIADLIIAKHRNGPLGELELFFNAQLTQFANLEGE